MADEATVVGVDVGTGSARAGVFTLDGSLLGQASHPITLSCPRPDYAEQSSEEIWVAVRTAVRAAIAAAGSPIVAGIGFDATCSLVVLDAAGKPLSVSGTASGSEERPKDVVVWMDHRAVAEAEQINATRHAVLDYAGGRISPEMNVPKLLWLLHHRPSVFSRAGYFFGLPDFLTWRATDCPSRSLCSTSCKWTYLAHEARWDENFFEKIGLGILPAEGFRRIGCRILRPGAPVGTGISEHAAAELGLPAGTPVGASAIDAHAGGIGVIGMVIDGAVVNDAALQHRLALIGGTSSCHMAVSNEPRFVAGVWGPFLGAMLPGFWLNEGGQSATGALIDHIITGHPAHPELARAAASQGLTIYELLNARLEKLGLGAPFPAALTRELHVLPDFHGNRSPRADPALRGMVSGLSLAAGPDDLALLYLATIQAIAYGTRHIIETLNDAGYAIDVILATGGGTHNPVFLREHADATGCRVALPREPEAVLLGAAILGAVAAAAYPSVGAAMAAMSRAGRVIEPAVGRPAAYHAAKYAVFRRLYADQMAYRGLMEAAGLATVAAEGT